MHGKYSFAAGRVMRSDPKQDDRTTAAEEERNAEASAVCRTGRTTRLSAKSLTAGRKASAGNTPYRRAEMHPDR